MMPSSPNSRCKYPYKMCPNTRTFKKDGEPHTLCEYHRNKANSIQKIYATKRRQELRLQRKSPPRSRSPTLVLPDPAPFLPNAALTIEPNDLVDLSLLFEDDFPSETHSCGLEVPDAALFMTSRLFTDRLKLSADDYDILCTLVD